VFPERVFAAIRRWFDAHAWPIRYRMDAAAVLDFLLSRGVARVGACASAHTRGRARALNAFVAETCAGRERVTPLATVLPGEPDAERVLEEGFALGLRGVKLPCHVQCFAPDAKEADPVYAACADAGLPLVMHAGREPSS